MSPAFEETTVTETHIHYHLFQLNHTALDSMTIHRANYSNRAGRKYLENIATGDTRTEVTHVLGMEEGVGMGGKRKGHVGLTVGAFQAERIWKGLNIGPDLGDT